jgi:16S rRNA (uracil1498-N3)-methyltransferase
MPTPRLFQKIALHEGDTLTLTLDAAHYLGTVRRAHQGDALVIFNGEGGEYSAEILALKKDKLTIKINAFQAVNNESPLDIHLIQGIARGEKMDWIVQKAVELGVKKITPLFTERSTVKLEPDKRQKRQQHWQAIAISACEQSGRNYIPEILLPLSFTEWFKKFHGSGIILSPASKTKIADLTISPERGLTLLVGPEGGLSAQEIDQLLQKDFTSLNLGPRILRTETAPLAVIAALQARFGDLG